MLTVLLGSTLKFEGRFILQTQSDGPVRMLVIDYTTPGKVRACARFDAARVAAAMAVGRGRSGRAAGPRPSRHDHRPGTGYGALPGHRRARRQGPRACGARVFPALRADPDPRAPGGGRGAAGGDRRRPPPLARGRPAAAVPAAIAGARAPARPRSRRRAGGDGIPGAARGRRLGAKAARWWRPWRTWNCSIPDVSAEQLLYRLFHERGVRVFRSRDLHAQCSCSRAGVERMLRSFPQDDRDHMVENGKITVTCEFCNSTYVFAPMDVREPEPSQPSDRRRR